MSWRSVTAWVLGLTVLVTAVWLLADPRLAGVVARLDRDVSGTLEPGEVGPVVTRDFPAIDSDGSGGIDGAEFRRWLLWRWLSGQTREIELRPAPSVLNEDVLRAWLRAPVTAGELDGVGLIVLRDGEVVFRHVEGALDASTPQALASASKWVTATVFACLAERGELDLERPLADQTSLAPAAWRAVSFDQMLSHRTGAVGGHALAFGPEVGISWSGRMLADAFPPREPGTRFAYGGVSMQVAGWMAEAITGRSWRRLFVECLAWPLSLDSASWGDPLFGPVADGHANLAAGLHMSLDDYGAFLSMLQQEGRYDGVPNMSARTVADMARERVGTLARDELPPGVQEDWGYALGAWCEREDADGQCVVMSSPGALGAYPWLDREQGVAGMILVVDALPRVQRWERATRGLVERLYGRPDSAP